MLVDTARHSIESYGVKFQDCDASGHLHLHRLMDYAQDCDDRNCRLLGVDSERLRRKNAAWIIMAYALGFTAPLPTAGDLLTIDSWSRGLDGIRFYRENRYYLGTHHDQNLIGTATSEWILVKADNHRPVRPASVLDPDEFNHLSDPRIANTEKIGTLSPVPDPLSAPCRFQYRVGFGDLDYNTHLHNTHYTRLAVDAAVRLLQINPGRQGLRINSFQICYKAEVNHDDVLTVAADFGDQPSCIRISGGLEGRAGESFLAKLTYEVIHDPQGREVP